jgi:hypothetical protein
MTNIERENRSILCHHVINGSVPFNARSLLINIYFNKSSTSTFNNSLIDNIKFYIKEMNKTDEPPLIKSSYSYP